jgi:hypothetical protein
MTDKKDDVESLARTITAYQKQAGEYRERIRELERMNAAKQARIDELMLEYCLDEMTPEQVAEWKRHQIPVAPEEARAIDDAISVAHK